MQILDLYCGAGGAAMGYYLACQAAGIPCRIVGVDRDEQPDYPFEFHRGDAVIAAYKYAGGFDFIHASPPCQKHSQATFQHRAKGRIYPDLIPATRHMMEASGRPGVIENVPLAPVRPDVVLRGDMFGLRVIRRRHFELTGWWMMQPGMPRLVGSVLEGDYVSVFGKGGYRKDAGCAPGWRPKFDRGSILATWQYAMGMDWTKRYESIAEAIPPAYTQYIFSQFINQSVCRH